MAMPRSRGGRRVTSRPPMRTSPCVGSSSPAIILSSVVLPEPEGPRNTRNSPSRTSRSTSLTAPSSPWVKILVSLRVSTTAMPPPLLPLVEDALQLLFGGPGPVLGRDVAAGHLREEGGDDEGVEDLVDGGGGVPRVADVGRPLEHVPEHLVLVRRARLGIVADELLQVRHRRREAREG